MTLSEYDEQLRRDYGASALIGVDEAGRGPLAGPVVACACIIPACAVELLSGVNDSKKLSPARREKLFGVLEECGAQFAVGRAESCEIDGSDILRSTLRAMRDAVRGLSPSCGCTLAAIDGNQSVPDLHIKQIAIVGGDAKSLSIAAASIIAKVTRDRLMAELDLKYPGYGFARHKGYGTSEHIAALARLGPCPEHRRSFSPVSAYEHAGR